MKETLKLIGKSSDKAYYQDAIKKLTDEQKENLERLVIQLKEAGCKNPLSWAFSEIQENIPQFARFLVLKNLYEYINNPQTSLDMAIDLDFEEDWEEEFEKISKKVGQQKLINFLKAYSKGLVYNIIGLLDEGNPNSERDKLNWNLVQTNEEGKLGKQIIQGLHESFSDFEEN